MDTELTNEPICPHCGHRERDAWEINFGPGMEGDTTVTCGSCGEDYFCSRQLDVSYTTSKLPACSASLVAQPPRDVSELYHELLYAVERYFPGESRHETALRHIRETERRVSEVGSCMHNARIEPGRSE